MRFNKIISILKFINLIFRKMINETALITEEDLINVMCHEMIHLNLYRRFILEKGGHGPRWHQMANELNEKYGLNIIQTYTDPPKQVGKLTFGEEIWQFIYNTFIFKEI